MALALSLPPSPMRDVIVAMTYIVVVFSITRPGIDHRQIGKTGPERDLSRGSTQTPEVLATGGCSPDIHPRSPGSSLFSRIYFACNLPR